MPESLTIGQALRATQAKLKEHGIETPDLDARFLLMHVLDCSREDLILNANEIISTANYAIYEAYLDRRIGGEPIDHILGYAEFYGLRFDLNRSVLSPRPETEHLVDAALEFMKTRSASKVLDLGTGTGAIIISILANAPDARGYAVDISSDALKIAKVNAKRNSVEDRIEIRESNWFSAVTGPFDLVVSNPPYIKRRVMSSLQAEVRDYDPGLALDGGEDGLDAYRIILAKAPGFLVPGGALMVEIGFDQGVDVGALFEAAGFAKIEIIKDYSGHDRVVMGEFIRDN